MNENTQTPEKRPLKQFIDRTRLQNDIAFNDLTLSDSFMNQASLYLHYSSLASDAQRQSDMCELAIKVIEAKLDDQIRSAALNDGKKTTEKQIENQIRINPQYIAAQKRRLEAEHIAALCKGAAIAFTQRRDMLIQAGSSAREERKGELRLNAAAADPAAIGQRIRSAINGER